MPESLNRMTTNGEPGDGDCVILVSGDGAGTAFPEIPPAWTCLTVKESDLEAAGGQGVKLPAHAVAAVVGADVENPALVARRLLRRVPDVSLFFLLLPEHEDRVGKLLPKALAGRRYELIRRDVWDGLATSLQRTAERFRKRRRLRTTLDRVNLQLRTEQVADSHRIRRMAISERFLASILAQTPDAIFSVDLQNAITSWNHAAELIFGLRNLEGVPLSMAGLGEATETVLQKVEEAKRIGGVTQIELHVAPSEDDFKWLDLSFAPLEDEGGKMIGVSVVARDITLRKRTAERLWERERQLANLVRLSPVAISRFDTAGRCIFANSEWGAMVGRGVDAALGEGWLEAVHPEDLERVQRAWSAFVSGAENSFLLEYRFVGGDGQDVWVQSRAARETDSTGRLTGFIRASTDITARKRAEDALEKMKSLLEERVQERTAELMEINEQLETFVYSAAHDLRAPLRSIGGFNQLVLSDYGDLLPEQGRHFLKKAIDSAERMDQLVQDLLEYSRIAKQEISVEPVELEEVLKQVRAQLSPQLEEREVDMEVTSPLPRVMANRRILIQVVANLISNGIKFVGVEATPVMRIYAEQDLDRVRLWVEDNGIGIEPQYHQKIFGVFERLHRQREFSGTGIGLAIVRKGMERVGGHAGVESAPGKGSRFWIELPAAA